MLEQNDHGLTLRVRFLSGFAECGLMRVEFCVANSKCLQNVSQNCRTE